MLAKKIFFDMDGTIADLYNANNWLENLRNENNGLFANLMPIHNMKIMNKILENMVKNGWQIEVITWLPMNASKEYQVQCTKEKIEWLARYMPIVSKVHAVPYGTPKHQVGYKKGRIEILIDDNEDIIKEWTTNKHRQAIQADKDLINKLIELNKGKRK
jgi:5'(3')-deoxyribonucleotidase